MKLLTKLCCMQLRTAALVLGVLGVMGASLSILISVIQYSKIPSYRDQIDPEYRKVIQEAKLQLIIHVALTLISLVTAILLIVGAAKRNHLYLLPWLIQSAIGIFLLCIGFVIEFIYAISGSVSIGFVFLFIVICSLLLALSVYIFMGIYSYYISLMDARRRNGQDFEFLNTNRSRSKV